MEAQIKKPPIGLKPKWLHDELRVCEIAAAIQRYVAVGKEIPVKWVEEYNEIILKGNKQ